jgi:hypothetical protein
MTLSNTRANGVRALIVWCSNSTCRHEAIPGIMKCEKSQPEKGSVFDDPWLTLWAET